MTLEAEIDSIKYFNMKTRLLFFLLSIFVLPTFGQNNQTPCTTEAHRQFDFWVGKWDVYHSTADTLVGRSHIKNLLGSCVIEENWESAGSAFEGKSLNTYNPRNKTWNQCWVDNTGATYNFSGTFENNVMLLKGKTPGSDGKMVLFEMSFTHNVAEGTVRQVWKSSNDGGETFATLFDGIYRKRE